MCSGRERCGLQLYLDGGDAARRARLLLRAARALSRGAISVALYVQIHLKCPKRKHTLIYFGSVHPYMPVDKGLFLGKTRHVCVWVTEVGVHGLDGGYLGREQNIDPWSVALLIAYSGVLMACSLRMPS